MSEHAHQAAFISWASRQKRDELDDLFAVPNGGQPTPRAGYVGLAIEFKFDDGNCSKEQRERITRMQRDGWLCVVVWDWQAAARTVMGYLDMPKWEVLT